MRGLFNRALILGAGVMALLATTPGACAFASAVTAPAARSGWTFDLDLSELMPSVGSAPRDVARYGTREIDNEFFLDDGLSIYTALDVDVPRLLDRYAPTSRGFDGLFYDAPSYAGLSNGGSYVGGNLALADDLHLSFGLASSGPGLDPYLLNSRSAVGYLGGAGLPFDARRTNSLIAGIQWNFAKWGGVGFSATQTTEHGGVLGLSSPVVNTARSSSFGVTANMGLGGGWMTTASYGEASTQLDLKTGADATATDVHAQTYSFAVAKHGVFGNDALGVGFSRPAPDYGTGTLSQSDTQFEYFGRDKLFANASQETEFELGYMKSFGGSVALQANASYQTNVLGGPNGSNTLQLLSRAKIKF